LLVRLGRGGGWEHTSRRRGTRTQTIDLDIDLAPAPGRIVVFGTQI